MPLTRAVLSARFGIVATAQASPGSSTSTFEATDGRVVGTVRGGPMRSPSSGLSAVNSYGSMFFRLALGMTFLSAVSDRLGISGPPGSPDVALGDLERFTSSSHAQPLGPGDPHPGRRLVRDRRRTGLAMPLSSASSRDARHSRAAFCSLFALGMSIRHGREVGAQRIGLLSLGRNLRALDATRLRVEH